LWLPRIAAKLGADLIHSAGYTGPLVSQARRVTSILDMNYRRHPEDLSLAERGVYAALIPAVARRSDRVLTLSEAARADIVHWTGVPSSKVSAIPLAPRVGWPGNSADDAARLSAAGVARPYILSVAAAYPHKNLVRLVQAFPLQGPSEDAVQLVMVGLTGRAAAAVHAAVTDRDHVRALGWVDDALLASLYRGALALAFPSLYEGFGLPILEAMALGTPVLTSNFGAMSEVAGGAAELVDPFGIDAIRQGLRRVAYDPRRRAELRHLGSQRAAQFSWTRTAEATQLTYSG
jgi:glycosyltransferase involved in cell wall biosynthesis